MSFRDKYIEKQNEWSIIVARVYANNYEDTTFSIQYYADGSDYPIEPRDKQDNTATYIKSNASNPDLLVCVAGTNNKSCNRY